MRHLGLIFAVLAAIILKMGLWGILAGFILGSFVDSILNNRRPSARKRSVFFLTTFEVLGHISKAKGKVTQTDIQIALSVMEMMNLNEKARIIAQRAFQTGKDANYPLHEKLRLFYRHYSIHPDLINLFFEIQLQSVFSDGLLHPKERQILSTIAEELRFSRAKFEQLLRMAEGGSHFQQQRDSQKGSQYAYYERTGPTLDDAYAVLNVKATDDEQTIKRAYRKLMNQHHPDKLVSKGLPPEMLEVAKKKAQEIQSAYDLIRQERGF